MRIPRGPLHRRALVSGVIAASVLLPWLVPAPADATGPGCASPPSIVDDPSTVAAHTTGVGYTTIEGSTPTTFDVDVLGVIPDGIMLDEDLIVARITGPQSFLDNAGGIFYGMSGSPVYIGGDSSTGDLLGAVSFSYWPDQTIVGLTPAAAMLGLFDLPTSSSGPSSSIALTPKIARAMAQTGTSSTDLSGTFQQMPTMLGVPVQGKRLRQFRKLVGSQQTGVTVVHAGAASPAALPAPSGTGFDIGEPVSSVLSYGDASIWAAGTVTIVCGNDQIAMYGHPLFWDTPGPVTLGLNGVNVLGISHASAWWNEMIPVVTDLRGAVTADRFAGEVGEVGTAISWVPITSSFSSPDSGRSRDGESDVVFQKGFWFEEEAWLHVIQNLDVVFQQIGPGTSSLAWTLGLQDANGNDYTLRNHTMMYSNWDATEAMWKLLSEIEQLTYANVGPFTFTGLDTHGSITADNLTGTIDRVRTGSGLQPTLRQRSVLRVHAGRLVRIEVTQDPAEADQPAPTTTFVLSVPNGWHGLHTVTIRGGRERYWIRGARTLGDLVAQLSGGEHSDDVIVEGIGSDHAKRSPLIVDGRFRFTLNVV
jgi:hypothetical protein